MKKESIRPKDVAYGFKKIVHGFWEFMSALMDKV